MSIVFCFDKHFPERLLALYKINRTHQAARQKKMALNPPSKQLGGKLKRRGASNKLISSFDYKEQSQIKQLEAHPLRVIYKLLCHPVE